MATAARTLEQQQPKASEPKVRRDGKCYVCKGTRPIVAVRNFDPFCSSTCCRKHHKVEQNSSS